MVAASMAIGAGIVFIALTILDLGVLFIRWLERRWKQNLK